MKENLEKNIETNRKRLSSMKEKEENLRREIKLLEQKLENQVHALNNIKE